MFGTLQHCGNSPFYHIYIFHSNVMYGKMVSFCDWTIVIHRYPRTGIRRGIHLLAYRPENLPQKRSHKGNQHQRTNPERSAERRLCYGMCNLMYDHRISYSWLNILAREQCFRLAAWKNQKSVRIAHNTITISPPLPPALAGFFIPQSPTTTVLMSSPELISSEVRASNKVACWT